MHAMGCRRCRDDPGHDLTGGVTNGEGTLLWTSNDGGSVEATGAFNFGKRHGHWVSRYADGSCINSEFSQGDVVSATEC